MIVGALASVLAAPQLAHQVFGEIIEQLLAGLGVCQHRPVGAGNLGILDYYKLRNIQADTNMRQAIAGTGSAQGKG